MTTNTIPPLTSDEKRKAWDAEFEAYMAKPYAGIAKVGPNRWFWVWWPNARASYDGADPERYGFTDSAKEAIDQCGGVETFIWRRTYRRRRRLNPHQVRLPDGSVLEERMSWGAHSATEWRSIFAARRKKPNVKAAPETQAAEYVYHTHISGGGYCQHRITKKTPKRIFIDDDCRGDGPETTGGVLRFKQMSLDRRRIEAGEEVWINHGRFYGAMCGVWFTLAEPQPEEAPVPDCFVALGLTSAKQTERSVKRAYRLQAKKLHPDTGGDAEAFRKLQEQYEAALALVESRTTCATN
jgi:hypothetical protein